MRVKNAKPRGSILIFPRVICHSNDRPCLRENGPTQHQTPLEPPRPRPSAPLPPSRRALDPGADCLFGAPRRNSLWSCHHLPDGGAKQARSQEEQTPPGRQTTPDLIRRSLGQKRSKTAAAGGGGGNGGSLPLLHSFLHYMHIDFFFFVLLRGKSPGLVCAQARAAPVEAQPPAAGPCPEFLRPIGRKAARRHPRQRLPGKGEGVG